MTTVLIAVDGSELDRVVARRSLDLFGDDADFVVVNVSTAPISFSTVPLPTGYAAAVSGPGVAQVAEGLERLAREAEDVADRLAHDLGLDDAEIVGDVGDPTQVILNAAEEHDADVVVVGTRDRSWWSRLWEPSVSHGVTALAECPVLVVRDDHDRLSPPDGSVGDPAGDT